MNVSDIKALLSERSGKNPSCMTLTFDNVVLESHQPFAIYRITDQAIVHVILPLKLKLFIQNARGASIDTMGGFPDWGWFLMSSVRAPTNACVVDALKNAQGWVMFSSRVHPPCHCLLPQACISFERCCGTNCNALGR